LYPGIAVAETLKKEDPSGAVSFVGSGRGIEEEILKMEGFEHQSLSIGRLKGEGWREKIRTLFRIPSAIREAQTILATRMPDVVFGIGGYSSGPVIIAALLKRLPRAILEPNTIPGLTNRILGRFAQKIFISFPETARFFPRKKVRLTGTPVREELTEIGRNRVPAAPGKLFTILVLGGSQGATAINQAIVDLLPTFDGEKVKVIHQTGSKDFTWVKNAYDKSLMPHAVSPFIKDMAAVYREADLVVSRAGASTIAELIETRSPSILVPYPYAADNHQKYNALSIVQAGGAEMVLNERMGEILGNRILYYMENRKYLERMKDGLSNLRKVPAAEAVAKEFLEMVR
jgi:UDP-N-acetylglucosamine--N-acetylmuramyl-(pentapeptide) pyrophosphoryl-undecaprenol N-acetylglucosamine transferase